MCVESELSVSGHCSVKSMGCFALYCEWIVAGSMVGNYRTADRGEELVECVRAVTLEEVWKACLRSETLRFLRSGAMNGCVETHSESKNICFCSPIVVPTSIACNNQYDAPSTALSRPVCTHANSPCTPKRLQSSSCPPAIFMRCYVEILPGKCSK